MYHPSLSPYTIQTTVYRKPTHTERYIHCQSYHPLPPRMELFEPCSIDPRPYAWIQTHRKMRFLILFQCFNRMDIHFTSSTRLLDKDQTQHLNHEHATISIPYVKGVSEKIKRVCAKERIHACLRQLQQNNRIPSEKSQTTHRPK